MYRVELTRAAVKQLRTLDAKAKNRIDQAIENLQSEPRPAGCLKMSGRYDTWRIRVGDYRVVYEIHDDQLVVLIVRVAHRRDVYR